MQRVASIPSRAEVCANSRDGHGPDADELSGGPASAFDGLNPGDKIAFTIAARKSTITAIEVIEAAK
jgi:hypothetical protein